jgi:hypothetical protein
MKTTGAVVFSTQVSSAEEFWQVFRHVTFSNALPKQCSVSPTLLTYVAIIVCRIFSSFEKSPAMVCVCVHWFEFEKA